MKMTKIQQLLSYQEYHDSTYHPDIYNKDVIDKLKHFCLHYTKYFSSLVLNNYHEFPIKDSLVSKLWVDTLIISLSCANTLNIVLTPDNVNFNIIEGKEGDINYNTILMMYYSESLFTLSKALDAYDHIEDYTIKPSLVTAINSFLLCVQKYIYSSGISNFETLVNNRYGQIRDLRLS